MLFTCIILHLMKTFENGRQYGFLHANPCIAHSYYRLFAGNHIFGIPERILIAGNNVIHVSFSNLNVDFAAGMRIAYTVGKNIRQYFTEMLRVYPHPDLRIVNL